MKQKNLKTIRIAVAVVMFVLFFGVGIGESDADAALAGIGAFRRWLKSLGLPLTFAELGAREEDIPLLVKTLNLSGNTLGGFRPLDEADVTAIYRMCL